MDADLDLVWKPRTSIVQLTIFMHLELPSLPQGPADPVRLAPELAIVMYPNRAAPRRPSNTDCLL